MKRIFLYVSLIASFLLTVFIVWLVFFPYQLQTGSANGDKNFFIVMNKPYFVSREDKTLLVYDRVFINESVQHLTITRGMICVHGEEDKKLCSSAEVDYFLGPSSDLVQTNQYVILDADTKEIYIFYEGVYADGKSGTGELTLSNKNRKLAVKEGRAIQYEVIR